MITLTPSKKHLKPLQLPWQNFLTSGGGKRFLLILSLGSLLPATSLAATIEGTAFEDKNDNGIFEPGEPPLPNTTIFIRDNKATDAGEGGMYTTMTDDKGQYFAIHDIGYFTLWSEIPYGWIQTTPIRGEGIVFHEVDIFEPNQTLIVDFGFFNPDATTNIQPETNQAPQADFLFSPQQGFAPLSVFFDGRGSFDPDGEIVKYEWRMQDGSVFGTEEAFEFTFPDPGEFEFKLVVTDNKGEIGTAFGIVKVESPDTSPANQAPVAKLWIEPKSGFAPLTIELDGNDSSDDSGKFECEWQASNGKNIFGCQAKMTFDEEGEYEIALIVTDNEGLSATMIDRIKVEPPEIQIKLPPTAKLAITPKTGTAPLKVDLDGEGSSDPDGEIVKCEWQASNGKNISGCQAQMTFDKAGEYEITLTVTDNDGQINTAVDTVIVKQPSQKPIANFNANPKTGMVPLTVDLDGNGSSDPDGEIKECEWQVSGQPLIYGCNTQITFDTAGTYNITLTVTDNDGLTDTAIETVIVQKSKQAPIAKMSVNPISGQVPLTVEVNGTASYDPDGTVTNYEWTVSNGKTAFGSTANFVFDEGGQYNIALQVTDNDGLTSQMVQQTVNVTAPNQPPIAELTVTPIEGDAPLTVTLNGTPSFDPDGSIINYAWVASDKQRSSGKVTTMTFEESGTYTISLIVTDNEGETNTNTALEIVKVGNKPEIPPIARPKIAPIKGEAPLTIDLDGQNSFDKDGEIVDYQWQASDGQQAFSEKAEMIFSEPGKYQITLMVTDNDGLHSSEVSRTVEVTESGGTPPVARFAEIPVSGQAPFTVELDASESFDPDKGGIVRYQWKSSDGQTTLGSNANFTFEQKGNYEITLTVTDEEGLEDSSIQTITITEEESEIVKVDFDGLKENYAVGEMVTVDLIETVKTNRFNRVDLWIAIQIPTGELLFRTPLPLIPFDLNPQPYKESLESSDTITRFLDFEVVQGLGGTYTFYALYVKEGENPMNHLNDLTAIQRSNLAIKQTTLANEP